jgi:hypothetical protein
MGNTIGRPTRESFGGRVIRPAVQRLVCIVDDRHQVTERRTA